MHPFNPDGIVAAPESGAIAELTAFDDVTMGGWQYSSTAQTG